MTKVRRNRGPVVKNLANDIGPTSDHAVLDELRSHVEALTSHDHVLCVSTVVDVLDRLSDIREFSAARVQLLEACHVRLQAVAHGTGDAEPGARMPLETAQFLSITRLLEALDVLGAQYRLVGEILDQSAADADAENSYQEACCLYRQLEILDTTLISSTRVYLPTPALLWTRTHAIVERAMCLDALDFRPAGALDAPGLGDLYGQMLLTILADPYRLTFRQLAAVRGFICESVSGAEFRTPAHYAGGDSKRRYLFAIDFDLDVAALAWRATAPGGSSEFELVLDVSRLVRLARKRQLAIRNDPNTQNSLLAAPAGLRLSRRAGEALYKHLVVEWGKQPIRKSERRAEQRSYDCLIGFDAVQQAHRIDFSDSNEEPQEIVLSGGVGERYSVAEPSELAPEDAGVVSAVSADVSATGIRLVMNTPANSALRIGELVGWRDVAADKAVFMTGLIRWMRCESSETAEVGVLVLGRFHDLAALHVMDDGEASRSSMPALLLTDSPYRGSREWLLTSDIVNLNGDSMRLVTSSGTRQIDALRPALQTRHVVCHSGADSEDRIPEPA